MLERHAAISLLFFVVADVLVLHHVKVLDLDQPGPDPGPSQAKTGAGWVAEVSGCRRAVSSGYSLVGMCTEAEQ